jgi:hypothetical protein
LEKYVFEKIVVFFLKTILLGSVFFCLFFGFDFNTRDHLQGDLATFGYRPTIKVEIYLNGFISWLLGRTMSRNMAIF